MAEYKAAQPEAETAHPGTERPSKTLTAAQSTSSESRLAQRPLGKDGQMAQRPADDAEDVTRSHRQVLRQHDRGGAPAVRLDMDLDIDIELKAKIKGYVELSIL